MANRLGGDVLRTVRSVAVADDATDRELLARFTDGDEAAFSALVNRHAGLVLGVCRRALPTIQDAEDACQAVFLILAKKASSGRWQPSIANWLYTTARRVALKANRTAARRAQRESQAIRKADPSPLDEMTGREAFAALDEELDRLSPIYREPLVLCYLQGMTRDEAAARLGVPLATLKSQLDRGRKKLGDALGKRGIVMGAGFLGAVATSSVGAAPAKLMQSILATISGSPPLPVAALAKEAAMNGMGKSQYVAVIAVGLALLGTGYVSIGAGPGVESPTPASAKIDTAGVKRETDDAPGALPKKTGPVEFPSERTFTGKVLGVDGKPIVADLHLIWRDDKPQPLGKTNPDGTFRVTVSQRQPWASLAASVPGLGLGYLKLEATTPETVTLQLAKDLPIRGQVIETEGKPVVGANIRLLGVCGFTGGSLQPFLDGMKKRTNFREEPEGERTQWLGNDTSLPFATTSDRDGRFEFTGAGAERLVSLEISAPGRATTTAWVVTRAGFEPKPYNDVTLSLRPTTGEQLNWSFNPILVAPDFRIALEREKLIRGKVTDAKTKKPRAGAKVTLKQDDGIERLFLSAITNSEGYYEIHGAKKWRTYELTIKLDVQTGYLPPTVVGHDTEGFAPVVTDIACPKGVIVAGTVRDKSTGKPIPAYIHADVLAANTYLEKYPEIFGNHYPSFDQICTQPDGRFRMVVIPGPVLFQCDSGKYGSSNIYLFDTVYRSARPDPNYPKAFFIKANELKYYGAQGNTFLVYGNWCKVIDAQETDTLLTQDIELERAPQKTVRVVDPDGRAVGGVNATGIEPWEGSAVEVVGDSDAITIYNLEPKQERLVVAFHEKRKLVGAAVVKEADKAPVVQLGSGGRVTGRVLNRAGEPMAGVKITMGFDRREVEEVYGRLVGPRGFVERPRIETGADGAFTFETILPGYEFRLWFEKGKKQFKQLDMKPPKYVVGKHGDEVKLGDVKVGPAVEAE